MYQDVMRLCGVSDSEALQAQRWDADAWLTQFLSRPGYFADHTSGYPMFYDTEASISRGPAMTDEVRETWGTLTKWQRSALKRASEHYPSGNRICSAICHIRGYSDHPDRTQADFDVLAEREYLSEEEKTIVKADLDRFGWAYSKVQPIGTAA